LTNLASSSGIGTIVENPCILKTQVVKITSCDKVQVEKFLGGLSEQSAKMNVASIPKRLRRVFTHPPGALSKGL
jgi:hypothetical protein